MLLDNFTIYYLFNPESDRIGLISSEALNETVELRVIYFQLGQLMDTTYSWLRAIDNPYGQDTFLEKHYPCFAMLYRKRQINKRWAKRTYAHIG